MNDKEVISIKNISIDITTRDKDTDEIFDARIIYDINDKKDSTVELENDKINLNFYCKNTNVVYHPQFSKIRNVLDKYDGKYPWIKMYSPEDFINELTLALYEESNVYWLSRGLKVLSDKEVPDNMKRAILNQLGDNSNDETKQYD